MKKQARIRCMGISIIFSLLYTVQSYAADKKVSWFTKMIETSLGESLEAAYQQLVGVVNQWVFQTPLLIEFTWITNLWWYCYAIAVVGIVIGAGITILSIFMGRRPDTKGLGKALLIGFIGCSLALYVSDQIISLSNMAANALLQDTLVAQYKEQVEQGTIPDLGLKEEEIGFESFDSPALCKLAFGGTIDNEPFYTVFLSENDGGGVFIMIWAMVLMGLMGLFGIVRYGVIGILGAGSSLWFSQCSFKGDLKPAIGYINLFGRSVLLSFILDIAWLFSVKASTSLEFGGLGNQIISCIIFSAALALSIWIWLRWVVLAAMQPMTLAGAKAQEHYGNMGNKVGSSIQRFGQRFGLQGLEHAGGQMQATGSERAKIAREKQNDTFDPLKASERDRLENARDTYIRREFEREAKRSAVEDITFGKSRFTTYSKTVESQGMDQKSAYNTLVKGGLEHAVRIVDGEMVIQQEYLQQADQILQKEYTKKHLKEYDYNGHHGAILQNLDPDQLRQVTEQMEQEEITYKNLCTMEVSTEELKEMEKAAGSFKPLEQSLLQEMPYKGQQGYEITLMDTKQQPKLEAIQKMFDKLQVDYERVGHSIFFSATDYDQLAEKVENNKKILSGLNRSKDGGYRYTGSDPEEIRNTRDMLQQAGLKYEEQESVWMDTENQGKFLDSLLQVYAQVQKETEQKEYAVYAIRKEGDYETLLGAIEKQCPGAVLKDDRGKRQLTIDTTYTEEVEKILNGFYKRIPYWVDHKGGYYYLETKIGRVVKHLQPPPNGRNMGTYGI